MSKSERHGTGRRLGSKPHDKSMMAKGRPLLEKLDRQLVRKKPKVKKLSG